MVTRTSERTKRCWRAPPRFRWVWPLTKIVRLYYINSWTCTVCVDVFMFVCFSQGLFVAVLFCFLNGEVIAQVKRKWRTVFLRTRANSYTATQVSVSTLTVLRVWMIFLFFWFSSVFSTKGTHNTTPPHTNADSVWHCWNVSYSKSSIQIERFYFAHLGFQLNSLPCRWDTLNLTSI